MIGGRSEKDVNDVMIRSKMLKFFLKIRIFKIRDKTDNQRWIMMN